MKKKHPAFFRVLGSTLAILLLSTGVLAKDCPTGIKAVTNKDPKVQVDVLMQRVKPLTKCELEVEAQAWLLLLKAKVTEISNAEVAVIYKKEEKKKAEDAAAAMKEAQEAKQKGADVKAVKETAKEAKEAVKQAKEVEKKLEADANLQKQIETAKGKTEEREEKEDVKTALLVHVNDLVAERTALIDRLNVVLTELKAKGGDPKEYDTYITAVSGIKVDVTDASATWTTITGWLSSPEGGYAGPLISSSLLLLCSCFICFRSVSARRRKRRSPRHRIFPLCYVVSWWSACADLSC